MVYVPVAALIGMVFDEAVGGSEAALLAVAGGALVILSVSPAYSLSVGSGAPFRHGFLITIGTVLLIWFTPIRDRVSDLLSSRQYRAVAGLCPVVVTVVLTTALVGVPPTQAGGRTSVRSPRK